MRVFVVLFAVLFTPRLAGAAEIGPVAHMERVALKASAPAVPTAPRLADAYGGGQDGAFHISQAMGVITWVGAVGIAVWLTPRIGAGSAVYGFHAANLVGTLSALSSVVANAMITSGRVRAPWLGGIALAAGGIGLVAGLFSPYTIQELIWAPAVTAPIVLAGSLGQLAFNIADAQAPAVSMGVAPIEQGVTSTISVRFR